MKRLTAVRAPVITPEPEAVSEPWIAMPEEERKKRRPAVATRR